LIAKQKLWGSDDLAGHKFFRCYCAFLSDGATPCILSANLADALEATTPGETADWSNSQLRAIHKEQGKQLVSQSRRMARDETVANEVASEKYIDFEIAISA
jgi:hypothetical protein